VPRVFIGVVAPIDPRIETPEEIRDRILEAVEYLPFSLARPMIAASLHSVTTGRRSLHRDALAKPHRQ